MTFWEKKVSRKSPTSVIQHDARGRARSCSSTDGRGQGVRNQDGFPDRQGLRSRKKRAAGASGRGSSTSECLGVGKHSLEFLTAES